MEANKVLNEIFKLHDEYSFDCVFNESDIVRCKAFEKAEALRELIQKIEESITDEGQQKIFKEAKLAHYKAQSQGIFYKRRVKLE